MISMKYIFVILFGLNIAYSTEFSNCPNGWIDGSLVVMGCLYFNHSQPLTWFEAAKACQQGQTGAKLIEILSSEVRLSFTVRYRIILLNNISFSLANGFH